MDGSIAAFVAVAGAVSAVVVAVVNGVITRRRTGAETTELLVRSAGGVVERLTSENERQGRELGEVRQRVQLVEEHLEVEREERKIDQARWERERIAWRSALQVHVYWDVQAIQALLAKGLELPDPPPLTPPTRTTDYPASRNNDPREMS